MRRITSPCLAALLIAAIAISTAAAPDWRGQAAPIGGSVACNVGLITGTVGELTTFNSTGGGTSALTTTGGVGAKWNGNDYPHADSIAAQKVNDVVHQYARHSTDPATFTVNLTSNITQTGSARQFSPLDPQWWWDSAAGVSDSEPVCSLWTPGGGWVPYTPTISTNQRASALGGDAGNQHVNPPTSNNNNGTVPPSSTSQITGGTTNGVYSSTSALPTGAGSYKVGAHVQFTSAGAGCVDNAMVTNDKLELSFTFATSAQ